MTTLISDFSHSDPFRVPSSTTPSSSSSRIASTSSTSGGLVSGHNASGSGGVGTTDHASAMAAAKYYMDGGGQRELTPPFSPNDVTGEIESDDYVRTSASTTAPGYYHTDPNTGALVSLSPPPEPANTLQSSDVQSSPQTSNANSRKRATYGGPPTHRTTTTPSPPTMTPEYTLHPSIAAYQTAHPRRALINFGPYILLQTLGEGEFGKVKLGVHQEYGEEVAVKLIRRGSVDNQVRLSKVEREIEVLKTVKHPNIVRLFDVIETEKYIGIILDFANGGELFDHILAHRYLKERDASKLFAQLISGVHYLHQKHIVHRDLKLENLLLDKHRNVIITDFGFANRFEHRQDDLMATSCGSPCYAAPELVISEGLYVGSAVDIWSCGVILYAMLSGYLPFDDDPANPDGNNINLLYRYIVNTPLTFPSYISAEAKDLLSKMLVPDPLNRCDLQAVMAHPWLRLYTPLFRRSIEELEGIAQEHQDHKRAVSRREMQARMRAQEAARIAQLARHAARAASLSTGGLPGAPTSGLPIHQRHQSALPSTTTMPDLLYKASSRRPVPTATLPSLPTSATSLGLAPSTLPEAQIPFSSRSEQSPRPIAPTSDLAEVDSSESGASTDLGTGTDVEAPTASRHRVESIQLPSTPKGKSSRSQPLNDITPTQATVAPARQDPGKDRDVILEPRRERKESSSPVPSDGSKRRPASSNKNRHTIQVEYDGEAAYEKVLEMQEGRAAWARGERVQAEQGKDSLTSGLNPSIRAAPEADSSQDKVEDFASGSSVEPSAHQPENAGVPTEPAVVIDAIEMLTPPTSTLSNLQGKALPETPKPTEEVTPPASPIPAKSKLVVDGAPVGTDSAGSCSARASMPPPSMSAGRIAVSSAEPVPKTARATTFGKAQLPQPPSANRGERSRSRMSMDKFGLGKLLASTNMSTDSFSNFGRTSSRNSDASNAAKLQRAASVKAKEEAKQRNKEEKEVDKAAKKGRRTTLSLAAPFSRSQSSDKLLQGPQPPASAPISHTASPTPRESTSVASSRSGRPPSMVIQGDRILTPRPADRSPSNPSITTFDAFALAKPPTSADAARPAASSGAAKKVMDWFRRKSLAKGPFPTPAFKRENTNSSGRSGYPGGPGVLVPTSGSIRTEEAALSSSTSDIGQGVSPPTPTVIVTSEPTLEDQLKTPVDTAHPPTIPTSASAISITIPAPALDKIEIPTRFAAPQRANSHRPGTNGGTKSPFSPAASASPDARLRTHAGVVDQAALTSRPAKDVMAEVIRVLFDMGIEMKRESEYKLRCARPRRKKAGATTGLGLSSVVSGSSLASLAMIGNASTGGVDRRGLPMPSSSSGLLSPGGGLRGILRRGSSYAASANASTDVGSPILSSPNLEGQAEPLPAPLYGEHTIDGGDEVRFSVELTKIKNLPGLFSLDIKRLRGNIWSFKFVYQTVLERCETLTH